MVRANKCDYFYHDRKKTVAARRKLIDRHPTKTKILFGAQGPIFSVRTAHEMWELLY